MEVLTSAVVVCREVWELGGVEWLVSEFLDASVLWTMRSAVERCSCGTVRLLKRIAAQEDPDMDPLLKRANFTLCLDKAVWRGDFEVVRWIVEEYLPAGRVRIPVYTAVKHSRLEILRWLRANHNDRVVWDLSMVLQDDKWTQSDLQTLQWVHENVAPIDRRLGKTVLDRAVKYGLADRMEWFKSIGVPLPKHVMRPAVWAGSTAVMEWIQGHGDVKVKDELMVDAVCSGEITMVQWFYNYYGISIVSAIAVVKGAKMTTFRGDYNITHEFLAWVLEHLTISNKEVLASAIDVLAAQGLLEDVKTLHEISGNGVCSTAAMDMAATHGCLEIVSWLHDNRSEGCTPAAIDGAAGNGHLGVVKWLLRNRTEGCTSRAMNGAAAVGHLKTVAWLHRNRTEGCTTDAMDLAAANGHLSVVKYLHENRREGCTASAMDRAAQNGHIDVIKFLHEHRSEGCTPEALSGAAKAGHLEIVKWLYKNRIEGSRDTALHYATKYRRLDVMRWLYRRRINDPSFMLDEKVPKFNYLVQEFNWSEVISTASSAESTMNDMIRMHTKDEVSWLLPQLPNYEFSSIPMLAAINSNKLDIAMLLAKDGRFPCDVSCFRQAWYFKRLEILQWLVREFSDSVPRGRRFVERCAITNLFVRDALNELKQLTVNE